MPWTKIIENHPTVGKAGWDEHAGDTVSPWQNGHVESFHGSLRDECLDRELMLSLAEARVIIEDYRRHYNKERPHGGIGYRTPAQACKEAQGGNAKVASTTSTT